jgi:hypothetical protein
MVAALFVLALVLLTFGRLRLYMRTGLEGELIATIGGALVAIGAIVDSDWPALGGLVVGSIGLMMLATVENGRRNEIFRGVSVWNRFVGNVAVSDKGREGPPHARTHLTIATGVISIFMALIMYRNMPEHGLYDVAVPGLLGAAGIWFVTWAMLRK